VIAVARSRLVSAPPISQVQSWSWIIRNMFFDKLVATAFFSGFTARKCKMLPVQIELLPYLGIYILSEDMTPDGDLNAGEIRFIHHLKLGFSVVVKNPDPVATETTLDQAFWTIMNTLWRDPYLTNMIYTTPYTGVGGTPDNTRIEGVSRGTRRHLYGNAGLNNETPIGELQYEATVKYGADYAPIIPDSLLTLSVRTGVKPGDTPDEMAQRQQVTMVYEFTPESPPVELLPPVNSVAPVISAVGSIIVGSVLETSNGTWSNNPTNYTYQWQQNGVDIVGATTTNHTVVSSDVGAAIQCVVSATNAAGSGSANSNSVTPS
jgi:hypothetical protein